MSDGSTAASLSPLDVVCVDCVAAPGQVCTTGGRNREQTHQVRQQLARYGGVACPRCQAPAGEPCVTRQGIDKSDVHAVRARLTLRVMAV